MALTASPFALSVAAQPFSYLPSALQQEQQAVPAPSPAPPALDERHAGTLEPHKPVERELKGGQADVYTIDLKAGQFLHVVAEQKGIDVVLQLVAPDGKTIVEADSLNGAWGPEPASLIADTSGSFEVRVKSLDETSAPGKYEIAVTDLRAPKPEDEKRIAAERAFFEGVRLSQQGKEAAQKSVALLENALPLWRDLNDRYEEALSLFALGLVHSDLGENRKALEYYTQALPLRRAVGDRSGEAATLSNIGKVYDDLGEKQKALEYYNQALPLRRAVGDRSGEAVTLSNIGRVYSHLGEKQKALDYFNQALPLQRAVGDHSGEATTLNSIGSVYDDLGEKQKALEFYSQALQLEHAVGDRVGEAATLSNIGAVYSELGENQKALEYYTQALPLRRAVGDRAGEAVTLSNIGAVYDDLGEKQKALEYFTQALPLGRAVGDRTGEAVTLSNIGRVYDDLGEKQRALEYFSQALPLERAVGDRSGEAVTLSNIGGVYHDLGEKQKALDYYSQALPLWRTMGDRSGEATTLSNIGKVYDDLGEKQKALDYYNQALPLVRAVGDRSGEAATLNNIGQVYDDLGEKQKALEYYSQALPLRRAVGDRAGEATTLSNIGKVYDDLGEKQKALDYYNQALPLQRAVGDRSGEASTLSNIGLAYSELGDKQKALEYYTQALPLERAVGNRSAEAGTLNNIGKVYDDLGERQQALEYYTQALPLRREVGDRTGEATTLSNFGAVYFALGEKQKALEYFNQALPLERAVGDRTGEAVTLNNIGLVYSDLGERQKALEYYTQALPLERAVGDRSGEATTLSNFGAVYFALGDKQKALEYYTQALPLERAVGDRTGEAVTLSNIGRVYDDLGEKQKALEYFNQALPLQRAVGDRRDEAVTLSNIGAVYFDLAENQKALEYYTQALSLSRAVQDPLAEGVVLGQLMDYWNNEKNLALAIFFGKQSVNTYQQVRGNIRGLEKELQSGFLHSHEETYRTLADILISQGRLDEAIQVLDLLKDEEYFQFIGRRTRAESAKLPQLPLGPQGEALWGGYVKSLDALAAAGEAFSQLDTKPNRTPEDNQQLDAAKHKLDAATAAAAHLNDRMATDLANASQPPATASSTQKKLSPGTVALYTLVTNDKYEVIVVTPNLEIARSYPITAEDLRAEVQEFQAATNALLKSGGDDARMRGHLQELYRIMVGPIEKDLEAAGAKMLVWELDGVMRYIPLAALYDGHQYLVEKYSTAVLTSLADFQKPPQKRPSRGVGMGVSKISGDNAEGLDDLPSVPGELHGIFRPNSAGHPALIPGPIFLDDEFTEKNMLRELEKKYPVVHIASHFILRPGQADSSYLLLGPGEKHDGNARLTLQEIAVNPAISFDAAELVTFSACETAGGGRTSNGVEMDSLSIAAEDKHAAAVLATLWAVEDTSTGLLMRTFYRLWINHLGITKAEALRQAQLSLLLSARGNVSGTKGGGASARGVGKHPSLLDWAPFVLFGNWQ